MMVRAARVTYWKGELDKATLATQSWGAEHALLAWGNSVTVVLGNVEKIANKARLALQDPAQFKTADEFESVMAAHVSGIYSQIDAPPPKWTTPLRETFDDVVEPVKAVVKDASTFGAFGGAFALVVLGALYLVVRR